MDKIPVIVIVGPTAVGKTALSIDMAKQFHGEIISGDSMQVYKGLDIGTAKITSEEMAGVPHYLIDITEPSEPYDASIFKKETHRLIREIWQSGKIPFIVGGTGLYIQSVLYDYTFAEVEGDAAYREALAQKPGEELLEMLQKVDPESAERLHANNPRRIIRALEVHHFSGKKFSELQSQEEQASEFAPLLIGLARERELLYARIDLRVDIMMEQGLLEEARALYDTGLRDVPAVRGIGYKELFTYFDGNMTLDDAITLLKRNSRRFAKRQLTWFRNRMDVHWFDVDEPEIESVITSEIKQFLTVNKGF
ncbi:tRNA (adenosine(37)-N6)-dimethylallyltransferase MiaA [Listeria booriae]|uniref:tRNA dimethylallyltransferase n=1 Tax=Listeria booriae TaxID=1552123 RepID=A0A842G5E4_9LIST|nr:tRNA (adenosine(37)-N6)-dimethylallyltransferase MiaA [Listeria booriae]MBC2285031.1 tRNA (adenosine(37)-N6)-dimethylallyltransferase MiaA [Listeria booriae]MBC2294974.1 tRNA (adenosine(37)-N6)-dimethylallyltransferase MiaA [Listeria booriae]